MSIEGVPVLDVTAPIAAYSQFRSQLSKLSADNTALVFDYESPKGNKEARSHIFKLRQTKSAVEKVRKEEKAASLEYGRKVDAEAKEIITAIDAMIDVHAKPLEEIEERERVRVEAIRARIDEMREAVATNIGGVLLSSEAMRDRLAEVKAVVIDDTFGEFIAEAAKVKDATIATMEATIADTEKREAEAAELERLRREAAEREQKERDERIRREAEERAKRESEAKARAELEQAEAKARQEREAAERRELELKLAAEKAQREKAEAEQRAANAAKEAEERIKREADEQKRREEEETRKREADKQHRAKINNAAMAALVQSGISESDAKLVVTMIAKGTVPGVSIRY